jgi:hypothetical protein
MSGFQTHLRVGVKLHVVATVLTGVAYVASLVGVVTLLTVAACLPATVAGALFPDLDHHSSIPTRLFHHYGPWVAATIVAVLAVANAGTLVALAAIPRVGLDPGYLAGVASAGAVLAVFVGVRRVGPSLRPSHRGPTHRLPVALAVSGSFGASSGLVALELAAPWTVARVVAIAAAATFLLGVLSHLWKDGLLVRSETYTTVS